MFAAFPPSLNSTGPTGMFPPPFLTMFAICGNIFFHGGNRNKASMYASGNTTTCLRERFERDDGTGTAHRGRPFWVLADETETGLPPRATYSPFLDRPRR